MSRRALTLAAFVCLALSSPAQQELGSQVAAMLADPTVARDHWGILVTTLDGTPLYSLNEAQLFQPASNAKLFTTAAAMALLGPDKTFETRLVAEGALTNGVLHGNLRLVGGGDADFGGSDLPYRPPLQRTKASPDAGSPRIADIEEMADAAVAKGLREIEGDVVGDDSTLSWEPIPPDWAADDLLWGYGAPVSGLTVHDNQIEVRVAPNAEPGLAAVVSLEPETPYLALRQSVFTTDFGGDCNARLLFDRASGSRLLSIVGDIPPHAPTCVESLAIEDPAEYAAVAMKEALERRGVHITGNIKVRHWEPKVLGNFLVGADPFLEHIFRQSHANPLKCEAHTVAGVSSLPAMMLASHRSPRLLEDLIFTNKTSQNLHAELMLRNLGAAYTCQPDARHSLQVVRAYLTVAGIDKDDFVFFDGSGLSGHDLVTPRATARLLQFAAKQPWFAAWKASLPVGGVDGSLEHRFTDPPLKGHVFAKTGTLGEARALSGYLDCASGRTVIFSIFDGNHLPGTTADRDVMDRIVAAIAAAN